MIIIIFFGREGTGVPRLKFFCCFVDETRVVRVQEDGEQLPCTRVKGFSPISLFSEPF